MTIHALTNHNYDKLWQCNQDYKNFWPYKEFFHGRSETGIVNRCGHPPYKASQLIRNTKIWPTVFMPGISLVVDRTIADSLAKLHGIDLVKCEWFKTYEYPIDKAHIEQIVGTVSWLDDEPFEEMLRSILHDPEDSIKNIEYFEVVVARLEIIGSSFDCVSALSLPDAVAANSSNLRTCPAIHQKHAMVKGGGYFLCSEEAYRILSPHINDPQLFRQYALEIV
jgi:hypothetical protein